MGSENEETKRRPWLPDVVDMRGLLRALGVASHASRCAKTMTPELARASVLAVQCDAAMATLGDGDA